MATKYLEIVNGTSDPRYPANRDNAKAAGVYVDSNDSYQLKYRQNGTDKKVIDESSTQTLSGKTLTAPVLTNPNITGAVAALTADTTIDATYAGKIITLSKAAGLAVTLPAATGTGNVYRFVTKTKVTSGAQKIQVANATDYFRGQILAVTDAADGSAPDAWATASTGTVATESDTISADGSTQGGNIGDYYEIIDLAAGVFAVRGLIKASGTEASPFSAAV